MTNINLRRILIAGASLVALSGCNGANDIASPGTGGDVIINPPATPAPTPAPTPTPTTGLVTPAANCPTIGDDQLTLGDGTANTIKGDTGEYLICTLPARFNSNATLPYMKGVLYRMPGRVDVGQDGGPAATANDTNVTLTIDPGVIIYAGTGASWLAVNRGNKINAVGTPTKPIIFTSRENVIGNSNGQTFTESNSGQWGGVVLLGRAQVTDCQNTNATPGTVDCQRQTEGAADPALYGGATNTDNSGRMSYVQIRYSGFTLEANSELQSLTPSGVGSATQLDHIMSFNSSDDGAEFFGGQPRLKYFISVGAEDDNLDTDTGTKALMQYVLVVQRQGVGDAIIEADTDNTVDGNTPRQNTKVANFTFIDRSPNANSDQASILLRGGTDYTLVNGIMLSANNPCLRISRAQTASGTADQGIDEAGAPVFRSVVMQCPATGAFIGSNNVTDAQVEAIFGAGANNNSATFAPTLTNLFVNGAAETAIPAVDAHAIDPFFDTTTNIGAVKDANDTWYQGWTCNSAAAQFGGGNSGLCTTLPIYAS